MGYGVISFFKFFGFICEEQKSFAILLLYTCVIEVGAALSIQLWQGCQQPVMPLFAAFTIASTLRVVMSPRHKNRESPNMSGAPALKRLPILSMSATSVIPRPRMDSCRYSS